MKQRTRDTAQLCEVQDRGPRISARNRIKVKRFIQEQRTDTQDSTSRGSLNRVRVGRRNQNRLLCGVRSWRSPDRGGQCRTRRSQKSDCRRGKDPRLGGPGGAVTG
ncbi:hypothetical protein CHARACLAT_032770 [Characodon lateralis]|uniref:Uncharacterized protein n=1 Tax=Characodon lateralis TaxID=208331 RepID=A0ABU7DF07_9TELE|nr:hypothetical protein [Characodon lateralis]